MKLVLICSHMPYHVSALYDPLTATMHQGGGEIINSFFEI